MFYVFFFNIYIYIYSMLFFTDFLSFFTVSQDRWDMSQTQKTNMRFGGFPKHRKEILPMFITVAHGAPSRIPKTCQNLKQKTHENSASSWALRQLHEASTSPSPLLLAQGARFVVEAWLSCLAPDGLMAANLETVQECPGKSRISDLAAKNNQLGNLQLDES